jgi:hypothetical protein
MAAGHVGSFLPALLSTQQNWTNKRGSLPGIFLLETCYQTMVCYDEFWELFPLAVDCSSLLVQKLSDLHSHSVSWRSCVTQILHKCKSEL